MTDLGIDLDLMLSLEDQGFFIHFVPVSGIRVRHTEREGVDSDIVGDAYPASAEAWGAVYGDTEFQLDSIVNLGENFPSATLAVRAIIHHYRRTSPVFRAIPEEESSPQ